MCRLKSFCFFYCVIFSLCSFSYSDECTKSKDEFSKRMIVQESLDYCLDTIYDIKSGKLSQEDGLDQLEVTLGMVKFVTWFFIED